MTKRTSVSELATALRSAAPSLDLDEQRLVVGLYQALAQGAPVSPATLANQLDVPVAQIEEALDRWPGVYQDEGGDVIGFWGIALGGMPHHLPLLDADSVEVQSKDPVTREEIRLTIDKDGAVDVSPDTTVVSMLVPDGALDHDVVQSFCHYVWFFASRASGDAWVAEHPGTFLLEISEANDVARRSWPALVQAALDRPVA